MDRILKLSDDEEHSCVSKFWRASHLLYCGRDWIKALLDWYGSFDQLNRMLFQFLLLLRIQNVRFNRLAFGDKFGVHVLYRFYT
ncbi:hypothetical protein ACLKA6_005747 [Drosophila palustris]